MLVAGQRIAQSWDNMNPCCWQSIDLVFPVYSRMKSRGRRKKPTKNLSSPRRWARNGAVSLIGPTRAPNRNRNSAGVFAVFARMILTARKNVDFGAFFLEEAEKKRLVGWTTFEYDCYFVDEFPLVLILVYWSIVQVTYCLYLLSLSISSGERKHPAFSSPPPPRCQYVRLIGWS